MSKRGFIVTYVMNHPVDGFLFIKQFQVIRQFFDTEIGISTCNVCDNGSGVSIIIFQVLGGDIKHQNFTSGFFSITTSEI